MQRQPVPTPADPLRVALIGCGQRARNVYRHVFSSLSPWVNVVAVCDPVREHADAMATALGAAAFHDIRALVQAKPMEGAIVVTPVESHHSISVLLSSNGIHNLIETTWSSMVCQSKDMIATARKHGMIVRVAENFFRFPIDRFAKQVKCSGYLGHIGRVFSYADHTGYHNNSRWIAFAEARPEWVQCVEHTMTHPAFYASPVRRKDSEALNARFFGFPDGFLVCDIGSGHIKGHLGRHPRPGYTEWHGERGTLIWRATTHEWGREQGELRLVSDERFAPHQEAQGKLTGGGMADVISPVMMDMPGGKWQRTYAEVPGGCIEYVNPFDAPVLPNRTDSWYGAAVVDHIVDFALAVRGLRASEFTDEDALMSEMMKIGARESALHEGKRIKLPVEGDLEMDAITRDALREKYGVDPLDVEAMLSISYPKP